MGRKPRPARASKLLIQMSRNPKADWRIEQLETVARAHDVSEGIRGEALLRGNNDDA